MSELYSRTNPLLCAVSERYSLCAPSSGKDTQHVVLDADLAYEVGDSIAIQPYNHAEMVEKTLKALKLTGSEEVRDPRGAELCLLRDFLRHKASLSNVSRKLVQEIADRQHEPFKKKYLNHLLHENDELKKYLLQRELWDTLLEHAEVSFTPQEIADLASPLLPRFYSIASSPNHVKNEVHLTVARVRYEAGGHQRHGVCTNYLCDMVPLKEKAVPVYIQPHKGFTIPKDHNIPIIMIGPGTGVAPFRAFMQERLALGSAGGNWLFFGDWRRDQHFLYGNYWTDLVEQGKLKLDLAFSRDQQEKIYVQHRMKEKGEELFRWIADGAYIYVCGDAQRMAKDVEQALLQIIEEHGRLSAEDAQHYLKELRRGKRYLRDVY